VAARKKSIHHGFKYFEESFQRLINGPESASDLKFGVTTSNATVFVHMLEFYFVNISPKSPDFSSYRSPQKYSTCLDT